MKKAPTKQAKKSAAPKKTLKKGEGKAKKTKHDEDAAPVSKRHISVEDREVSDPKGLIKALTALEAVDEEAAEVQARRQKILEQVRSAAGSASFVHPKSKLKFTVQGRGGQLFIRESPVPTPKAKPAKKSKKSKD
jgi:hypothetical protein